MVRPVGTARRDAGRLLRGIIGGSLIYAEWAFPASGTADPKCHERRGVVDFCLNLCDLRYRGVVLTDIRQIRVDKAFLGASGVRQDGAVLDSTPSEVPVKRTMIDIAARSWLLVDHTKFPGTGVFQVTSVLSFAGLVTDREPDESALTLPDDHTVEVYLS